MNEDNKNQAQPGEQVEDTGNVQPPDTSENIVVRQGPAVEDDTVAASPEPIDQEPVEEVPEDYTVGNNEEDTTYAAHAATSASVPPTAAPKAGKKRLLIILAAVVVALAVAVLAWWMISSDDPADTPETSTVSTDSKLGVAVTVTDGTVECATGDDWQALTTDSDVQLAEGYLVRTGEDSRAVLTLDDGSAVRLDEQTEVKIVSLSANDVQINHIEGAVYSRVVPSDRKYTVNVDAVSYEALGTAFVTVKSTDSSGLQVFQSSVKASGLEDAVVEGKQYYVESKNAALEGKVTTINLAKLVGSSFVAWNVAEDKKDAKFKDSLGTLAGYDAAVAKEKARLKAEAEKKAAEQAAKEAAEKARLEAERKAREAANTGTGMTARLSDGGIFWTYSGNADRGFKVVYSATNSSPSFGQNDSSAIYVSDPNAQYLGLPKEMQMNKTYYVRVCAYQPDNSSTQCRDYSNVVQVKRT